MSSSDETAREPTGAVTFDSLAAENLNASGSFTENSDATISTPATQPTSSTAVEPTPTTDAPQALPHTEPFSGTHTDSSYVGGPTAKPSDVPTAPTYSADIRAQGELQPKGTDLGEADNMPEAKTFTGEVGGMQDPGRRAEAKMTEANAKTIGDGGLGEGTEGGRFDVLEQ